MVVIFSGQAAAIYLDEFEKRMGISDDIIGRSLGPPASKAKLHQALGCGTKLNRFCSEA